MPKIPKASGWNWEFRDPRGSALEKKFIKRWLHHNVDTLPFPRREYLGIEGRLYRFDFAWPEFKVALEIQGGAFSRGRHSRGAGMGGDYEKHNVATVQGWRVLYATGAMLSVKGFNELLAQLEEMVWQAKVQTDVQERLQAEINTWRGLSYQAGHID